MGAHVHSVMVGRKCVLVSPESGMFCEHLRVPSEEARCANLDRHSKLREGRGVGENRHMLQQD